MVLSDINKKLVRLYYLMNIVLFLQKEFLKTKILLLYNKYFKKKKKKKKKNKKKKNIKKKKKKKSSNFYNIFFNRVIFINKLFHLLSTIS